MCKPTSLEPVPEPLVVRDGPQVSHAVGSAEVSLQRVSGRSGRLSGVTLGSFRREKGQSCDSGDVRGPMPTAAAHGGGEVPRPPARRPERQPSAAARSVRVRLGQPPVSASPSMWSSFLVPSGAAGVDELTAVLVALAHGPAPVRARRRRSNACFLASRSFGTTTCLRSAPAHACPGRVPGAPELLARPRPPVGPAALLGGRCAQPPTSVMPGRAAHLSALALRSAWVK